ncbi:MAG: hypothetical protein IJO13_08550 [Lachnospiraceae bacterium]|nr:hypothetical protein [Lachnospiraceae bacterium]
MSDNLLVNYYWDVLSKAETILSGLENNKQAVTPEARLLKGLAVAGLIRQNVKFHLIQPEKEVTTTKKVGFISITSTEMNDDFVVPKIIIKDFNGNEHECDLDVLKPILGPDFDILIFQKRPDGTDIKQVNEIKLPDLKEEDSIQESVVKKDNVLPVPEVKKDRLPEFIKDGRYKDDVQGMKLWDTFIYNHHALTIEHQGNAGTIHFYVYPLSIQENKLSTDIMVVAESGELCRANISRGEISSVELEFAGIPFTVRGSFQNGKFHSIVKPMIQEVMENMEEKIDSHFTESRTSTTYVQSEYHGIIFNIFPAKLKKNETGQYIPSNGTNGYAPAGIVITRDNHVEVLIPTSDGTFNVIGNNGENILIETFWNNPKQGYTFNYRFES